MRRLARVRRGLERLRHRRDFKGQIIPLAQAFSEARIPARYGVSNEVTASRGGALKNHFLRDALAREELGVWALDADTLNFLERVIQAGRPRTVLEFGAGLSTLCLARYLAEAWPDAPGVLVYSVEQNEWQVEQSRVRLAGLGLADRASIIHAPLTHVRIEGIEAECYGLPSTTLSAWLGAARPDLILVDGPSGDGCVRFGTLPLVKDYVNPGASFFLDDALRPEEREVARLWSELPYLGQMELHLRGKGLISGTVRPSRAGR